VESRFYFFTQELSQPFSFDISQQISDLNCQAKQIHHVLAELLVQAGFEMVAQVFEQRLPEVFHRNILGLP
jgi:tRNA G26 N,N-dimethylase Trm1